MIAYHDEEWGVPVHDDRRFFEFLILEGAQAGLSWSTVLRKRERYREAFAGFDPARVARFGKRDVERLLADPGIIRNRLKVEGAVRERQGVPRDPGRARQLRRLGLALRRRRADRQPPARHGRPPGATTPESDALSRELTQRGFKFVGSTICYAFMQATGLVNDHVVDCVRWRELGGAAARRPADETPAALPRRTRKTEGRAVLGFIALLALMAGAMTVFAAVAVVLFLVKLVFKIALFPIKLAGGLIFGVLGVIAAIVLAVVALPLLAVLIPVLAVVAIVGCVLAAIAGVCWLGFHTLAWIF